MASYGENSPIGAEPLAAEGMTRSTLSKVVTGLAVIIGVYHLFYLLGGFGYLEIFWLGPQHRGLSFFFLMILTFLIHPGRKGARQGLAWYDFVLIIASSVPVLYFAFFYETVLEHFSFGTSLPYEQVMGIVFFIVVLEAIRRTVGWGMVVIVLFFLIHPLIAEYFPGVLHGRGFSISRWVNTLFLGEDGVLGMPANIAATMVFAFVLFGQIINITGGGSYFIDVAQSLLGHMRGGPAKGAIVASGLFGMISGSTIANIATTGTFTIPLMKRIGYSSDFAGGVESVASNGGQIMPPIMGIVAFVMASFLEMSYIKICFYALLPAVLYYIAVFVMVDLQAVKLRLKGLPRSELPSFKKIFWRGWFLPIPIFVLIYLLAVLRYSPEKAALFSVGALVICTLFSRTTRLSP
ncbi:TRAP transporter permease, partial [Bacteroidota bacterium]